MEFLLKSYKELKVLIESIKYEVINLKKGVDENEVNEHIEGKVLRKSAYDEVNVSSGGHISDKTSNIALSYRGELEKENNELLIKLQQELFTLQIVLDKLDIGLRGLPQETTNVIVCKYINNLTWNEIGDQMLVSRSQAQDIRKKGIERLRAICRITIVQYDIVAGLLNL